MNSQMPPGKWARDSHGTDKQMRRRHSSSLSFGSSNTNSPDSGGSSHRNSFVQFYEEDQFAFSSYGPSCDNREANDKLFGKEASLSLADVDLQATPCGAEDQHGATTSGSTSSLLGAFPGTQPAFGVPNQGRPITKHSDPEPDTDLMVARPLLSTSNLIVGVSEEQMRGGSPFACTSPTTLAIAEANSESCNLTLPDSSCKSAQLGLFQPESGEYSPYTSAERIHNVSNKVDNLHSHGVSTPADQREATKPWSSVQAGEFSTTASRNFTNYSQDFSVPPPTSVATQFSIPPPISIPLPCQVQQESRSTFLTFLQAIINCQQCNNTHRWPHSLHCLHVFCFPCLTAKFDSVDQSIICPQCQLKTPLKDGPCSLKMDGSTTRLMIQHEISPFKCTACIRGHEAVICCTTCMAYLCSVCEDGHKNIKCFLNHSLTPITKLRETVDGRYTHFCNLHPSEQMTNYCCACAHMICVKCLPNHTHPEHTNCIPSLAEAYTVVAGGLHKNCEDSVIKRDDMNDIVKKAPLTEHQLQQWRRNAYKGLLEYKQYCHSVIDQNYSTGIKLVGLIWSALEEESQHVISNAQKASNEMKTFNEVCRRTFSYNAPEDTLDSLSVMENAYKTAVVNCSKVTEDYKHVQGSVTFNPDFRETEDMLNKNFTKFLYANKEPVSCARLLKEADESHSFLFHKTPNSNTNCSSQNWLVTPDTMPISTWNSMTGSKKQHGTFVKEQNHSRTKISFIHMFGENGRGEYAFTEPSGQAYFKNGSYVICDTNNHRLVHYSPKHEFIRTIGQCDNHSKEKTCVHQNGYLCYPYRVAICPKTQNIVVAERQPSPVIQIFEMNGSFQRCFGGSRLKHPRGLTVDEEGIIIVVECKIMMLVMFDQNGNHIDSHSIRTNVLGPKLEEFPTAVAAREGKIFISDNLCHCVNVFNYKAEHLGKIGSDLITNYPIGVSINHLNQVVVTNNYNTFNITVFDMDGKVLHLFESDTKLSQCYSTAVHPTSLDLIVGTKDCKVYFFNYDPNRPRLLPRPASHQSVFVRR
ncbi:hypothetical protein BsWGS_27151 [Bradybaena similaris]